MKTSVTLLKRNLRGLGRKSGAAPKDRAATLITSKVTSWEATTTRTARSKGAKTARLPYAATNRADDEGDQEAVEEGVDPPPYLRSFTTGRKA